MPFWADSAKCNFGRKVIFSFSLRKSQRLRQKEAHCSKNGLALTAHTVSLHSSAEEKSSDCRDTALAETPQACHSLGLEQHQRVIGSLGSPVRLTLNQAQGPMPAFTPKAATQDWGAQAKRDRRTTGLTHQHMKLPTHTGTGNVTSGAQVTIWATWHRGNKRGKLAQWHNASSGTTSTDGTQMKDFLSSLVSGAQQTETTLGKFVSNRGKS